MPYSDYLKRRALVHHGSGLSSQEIVDALSQEGLSATRQGIAKFLRRYRDTGRLERAKAVREWRMYCTAVRRGAVLSERRNGGWKR